MARVGVGWGLAKKSWGVVRADRSLLVFPIVGPVAAVLAFAIVWTPMLAYLSGLSTDDQNSTGSNVLVVVAIVVSTYVATAVAVYFNVALAACAVQSLQGKDTTFSEGIRAANARLRPILGWAVVASAVNLLLRLAEERLGGVGRALAFFGGVAWSVATFFAIPVIALEGKGPGTTLKRSGQIARAKWGEGITGYVAISAITTAAVLVVVAIAVGLSYAADSANSDVGVGVVALIAAAVVIAILIVASALGQIFRVAVYRYAVADEVTGGFERAELETAFRAR